MKSRIRNLNQGLKIQIRLKSEKKVFGSIPFRKTSCIFFVEGCTCYIVMVYCTSCGSHFTNDRDVFCTKCGSRNGYYYTSAPPINILNEEQLIKHYFNRHYSNTQIIAFLSIHHSIEMSLSTLKRRLRRYGLKRTFSNISIQTLRVIIQRELEGPNASLGYRGMWTHLRRSYSLRVKRDTVMEMLRELDPEGVADRRTKRLIRRVYEIARNS